MTEETKLKALASRHRLAVLAFMTSIDSIEGERGWIPIGTISRSLGMSYQSANKHFKRLTEAEILERRRSGQTSLYRVKGESLKFIRELYEKIVLEGDIKDAETE